jgi:hypothetical protein
VPPLGSGIFFAVSNLEYPPLEIWKEVIRQASDEDLIKLREHAFLVFSESENANPEWELRFTLAEDEMLRRGIKP